MMVSHWIYCIRECCAMWPGQRPIYHMYQLIHQRQVRGDKSARSTITKLSTFDLANTKDHLYLGIIT